MGGISLHVALTLLLLTGLASGLLYNGSYYIVQTQGDDFEYMWLDSTRPFFTFRVMPCDTFTVYLGDVPGVLNLDFGYYITFTGTVAEIEGTDGTMITQPAPYAMDCEQGLQELQELQMWISWEGSVIRAGQGELYQNEIVRAEKDPALLSRIRGMSLASMWSEYMGAKWTVPKSTGTYIHGYPDESTPMTLTTDNKAGQAFQVRAKNNATIRLLTSLGGAGGDAAQYEITIGYILDGQMKTVIRDAGNGKAQMEDTPAVLNDTEMRWFWVDWSNGLVQVGTGDVIGLNVMTSLQTTNKSLLIKFLSVYKSGERDAWDSEWEFSSQ